MYRADGQVAVLRRDARVAMSRRALQRARPSASEREIELALVGLRYGPEVALALSRRLDRGR